MVLTLMVSLAGWKATGYQSLVLDRNLHPFFVRVRLNMRLRKG